MEMSKLAQTAAKALGLPSLEDSGGGGQNDLIAGASKSPAAAENTIIDPKEVHMFHGSTSGSRVSVEV